jgi:hypothetical protein
MKAFELMYLAKMEPQKYEGKKYKITKGCALNNMGNLLNETDVINVEKGKVYYNKIYELNISQNTELEEIQQPIPFLEAVKAYSEGKTIRCEWKGRSQNWASKYKNGSQYMGIKECDGAICPEEILNGTWYLEDNHE